MNEIKKRNNKWLLEVCKWRILRGQSTGLPRALSGVPDCSELQLESTERAISIPRPERYKVSINRTTSYDTRRLRSHCKHGLLMLVDVLDKHWV